MIDQLAEIAHRLTVVLERLTELHADAVADARALEDEDDGDDATAAGRDLAGRQIVIGGSISGPPTLS